MTVDKANSSTVTEIHRGNRDDIAAGGVTSVAAGFDRARQGDRPGTGAGTPTGKVDFTFFTSTTAPPANRGRDGIELDANGVAHPSSSDGPLGAGTYSFQAIYKGDANSRRRPGPCEPLVEQGGHLDGHRDPQRQRRRHCGVTSVPLGSTVHDKATVTGTGAGTPTGNGDFTFFTTTTAPPGTAAAADRRLDANGVAHPSSIGSARAGTYRSRPPTTATPTTSVDRGV